MATPYEQVLRSIHLLFSLSLARFFKLSLFYPYTEMAENPIFRALRSRLSNQQTSQPAFPLSHYLPNNQYHLFWSFFKSPDAAQTIQADSQSLVPKFSETKASIRIYIYIYIEVYIYIYIYIPSCPLLTFAGVTSICQAFVFSSFLSSFLFLYYDDYFNFLLILFFLSFFYPLSDVVVFILQFFTITRTVCKLCTPEKSL